MPDEKNVHYEEVCSLFAEGELEAGKKRMLDFAKGQEEFREAVVLAGRISRLLKTVNQRGPTSDTKAESAELTNSALELVDRILGNPAVERVGATRNLAIETTEPIDVHVEEIPLPLKSQGRTPFLEARVQFNEARRKWMDERPIEELSYVAKGLERGYPGSRRFQLRSVDLELRPGQITGIVGVNGSGKSTLLKVIAGEFRPDAGEYRYPLLQPGVTDSRRIDWQLVRSQIAYLPQSPKPWPGLLVDSLTHAAAHRGIRGPANRDAVDFVLERLSIAEFRDEPWSSLSGGYQMRAEIAKALVIEPKLMILDEPLSPLDVLSRDTVLDDLRNIANSRQSPLPIVISSQNLYEVEKVSDQILVLDGGRPVYCGPPSHLGRDRVFNSYELLCGSPVSLLEKRLGELGVEIAAQSVSGYLLRSPLAVGPVEVLRALVAIDADVIYFRNISNSTRTLLGQIEKRQQ